MTSLLTHVAAVALGVARLACAAPCVPAAAPSLVAVSGLRDAVGVAIGGARACAVRVTGQVSCRGSNDGDARGGGETPTARVPVDAPIAGAP